MGKRQDDKELLIVAGYCEDMHATPTKKQRGGPQFQFSWGTLKFMDHLPFLKMRADRYSSVPGITNNNVRDIII